MTYGRFLALFLVLPIAVLVAVDVAIHRGRSARRLWWQLGLVSVLAIVYTGPWDGALIAGGVWSYGPGRVLGPTVVRVPLEEYGFYVLQVILAGGVAATLWARAGWR